MPSSVVAKLKPDTTVKVAFSASSDNDADNPRFVLGYWSIRGLAAPLRMMLCAAKVNHWAVLYDAIETPDGGWSRESWLHDKAWLRDEHNPFMNLPFLIDTQHGDNATTTIVNQTNAIFAYLGRELDMMGSDRLETVKCEELLAEVMDIRNAMVRFAYSSSSPPETVQSSAANLVASVQANFEKFERHLAKKYPDPNMEICYLVGTKMSAPDFHLWEMLFQFESLCQTYKLSPLFHAFPHLEKFKHGFAGLSENAFYGNSFLGRELPFNNPYAQFGSSPGAATYVRGQSTPWQQKGVILETIGADE